MVKREIWFVLVMFHYMAVFAQHNYTNCYIDANGNFFKMWVPPTTNNIRGLFIIFNQMMDNPGLDSSIRVACTTEDIAIVSVYNTGDTALINDGLKKLALQSGFPEVQYAPFCTFGHSAAVSLAKNMAAYYPDRCFGIVECNGVDLSLPISLTVVPLMVITNMREQTGGKYYTPLKNMLSQLRVNGYRCSQVTMAGPGHFSFTWFDSYFISMFLRKAAHYQIPYGVYAKTGPVILTRIPENQGWLTDTAMAVDPVYMPAPFDSYAGLPSTALWHFDGEMAQMWLKLHRQEFNKIPQKITQTVFSSVIPGDTVGMYWSLWTPSQTMTTGGFINFGASATSGLPLSYQQYYGTNRISADGDTVYFDGARQSWKNTDWTVIQQRGNETYRFAEFPVKYAVNTRSGASNNLTLIPIPDKVITDNSFPGTDTASSGLYVDKYIESGALQRVGKNWVIQDFSAKKSFVFIRFRQAGNNTFASSSALIDSFTIVNNRINQTINFSSISDKFITDTPFLLEATGTSGNTPEFVRVSGPCIVSGNMVTLTGDTGTLVLMAIIKGNTLYNSVKAVQYVKVSAITNISDMKVNKLKVRIYPNPVYNKLYISSEDDRSILYLINSAKSVVKRIVVTSALEEVDLTGFSSGIYFLKVLNDKNVNLIKIVKL